MSPFLRLALAVVATGAAMPAYAASDGLVAPLVRWAPVILGGFLFNVLVSILAMTLGTVAGAALGLGLISETRAIRVPSRIVTEFFRNAPWLVLLFYCILLIPFEFRVGGTIIPLPGWVKAVIGLALPVMANVAEIVRGAVQSIPGAQWESAESLGFSRFQTLWMIVLPQCLKRMLPPWMNLYAILTMATPLISIVGVEDGMTLTRAAIASEGRTDLLMPMYGFLLALFFFYCYPIARWTVRLERRFALSA
ncbi:Inner membrane amino-acid ABC transporter permease protein YhdY [Methylobacterium crusticola]|uniref:Inner membrane amino-acid ABC transporter permease protein YhdY n=1 Tax=Methylobacterium crusticola TaxID=1697972 RepID=A0ABQ4QWZ5_9HYPH|nr:amino acid ABC transporter permease [Methylobacterium crusticola]GJD49788.1 Inner membrane amino-acid ABC transporter permease protein YhdY [Methylobacterium crusticola]